MDDGDEGYWVSYDYQRYDVTTTNGTASFTQRSPHYGYDYQFAPDGILQEYPSYLVGTTEKFSGLFGSG